MSVKYKTGDDQMPHFITFSVVEWIDALTRNEYKDIILASLEFCIRHKGLELNARVFMSNHVHFVMSAKPGFTISNILRDLKKYTSKQLFRSIRDNRIKSRKARMLYMFERAGKRNSNNKDFQF